MDLAERIMRVASAGPAMLAGGVACQVALRSHSQAGYDPDGESGRDCDC